MEDFVRRNRELVKKEREADIEETKRNLENVSPKVLEQKGLCLLKLRISSRYVGLFNRNILVLCGSDQMPAHSFTAGDIVSLSTLSGNSTGVAIASGVVSKVQQSSISVAFDGEEEQIFYLDDSELYKIVKLSNDVTYRRLQKTLDKLDSKGSHLANVLFGDSQLSQSPNEIKEVKYFNKGLDSSQREAVKFALEQRDVAIIHGPPGTGKTTTVAEVIRQAVRMEMKVLVCAPSNIAVDNLVERLSPFKIRMVRIGHPARLLSSIVKHSLDAIVSSSDGTRIVEDVRKEINALVSKFCGNDETSKYNKREELRTLRAELREREERTVSGILARCQVVLCTLMMASEEGPLSPKRIKNDFDLVVIDECSQALEVACWTALMRGRKCVLAGDHNQLPPTILSLGEAREQLEITLMERLIKRFGDSVVRMLTTQYRMHERIMDWPSRKLYDGKLTADGSVAGHLLRDLPGVEDCELTSTPLLLIDTSGCGFEEMCLENELSKGNEGEADIVCFYIRKLLKSGLREDQIGVIVPYNLQVEILRQKLQPTNPGVEIKSVDGFQGREKEAILVSLVRSNSRGEVGFLSDRRRINVAVTRARRHLAVVCDSETVGHDEFIKDFLDHLSEVGEVLSAHEFVAEVESSNEFLPRAKFKGSDRLKKVATKSKTTDVKSQNKSNKKKATTRLPSEQGRTSSNSAGEHAPRLSDADRKKCFLEILNEFVRDDSVMEHRFPPSLSAIDRLFVHQLCEELGLMHSSEGEKPERFIRVSKKVEKDANDSGNSPDILAEGCLVAETRDDSSESADLKEVIKEAASISPEEIEQTITYTDSLSVQSNSSSAECYWSPFEERDEPCTEAKAAPIESDEWPRRLPKDNAKAKVNPLRKPDDATTLEKFDEILDEAIRENSQCAFKGCKRSIVILGQDCAFCKRRFCLTHHVAESHGCGEAAKVAARKLISREGRLFPGSGAPSKALKPEKRAHLKSKLENKLDSMAERRKGHSSSSKSMK